MATRRPTSRSDRERRSFGPLIRHLHDHTLPPGQPQTGSDTRRTRTGAFVPSHGSAGRISPIQGSHRSAMTSPAPSGSNSAGRVSASQAKRGPEGVPTLQVASRRRLVVRRATRVALRVAAMHSPPMAAKPDASCPGSQPPIRTPRIDSRTRHVGHAWAIERVEPYVPRALGRSYGPALRTRQRTSRCGPSR